MQRITPSSIVVHHKVAWAKPRTEFLIKLVRQHPCLYQPNALNYLDRDKRTKALQDIHRRIQKMIPEVTINDLKNKLKNLRTQYIKELRLVERSQGKGSEEEYKPKLWCYQMLSFFQPNPSINKRPVSSSSEHEDDDNDAVEENDNDDEEGTGTDSSVHNAKNNNKAQNLSDLPKCDKQTVKSQLNEYIQRIQSLRRAIDKRKRREYKYDWLGKMVASQMEQLDERTQIKVAWDIQCMLRKHLDKVQERTKPNDEDEQVKPEVFSDEDNPAFEFIVDNGDTLQQEELDEMELEYEIEEDDDDGDEDDDTE